MTRYTSSNISNAVAAICPDIQHRVSTNTQSVDEKQLWWELVTCILSSQVPYKLATAYSNEIGRMNLLTNSHNDEKTIRQKLLMILSNPIDVDGKMRLYRFPVARAEQISRAHDIIKNKVKCLGDLVTSFDDETETRLWFVKNMPGIGPKQASMFLRNIGISYELAILDRHVINYMSKIGIYTDKKQFVSGLNEYQKHELNLRKHAQELDCQVGILDWAIWIVMRAANRNMESTAS